MWTGLPLGVEGALESLSGGILGSGGGGNDSQEELDEESKVLRLALAAESKALANHVGKSRAETRARARTLKWQTRYDKEHRVVATTAKSTRRRVATSATSERKEGFSGSRWPLLVILAAYISLMATGTGFDQVSVLKVTWPRS